MYNVMYVANKKEVNEYLLKEKEYKKYKCERCLTPTNSLFELCDACETAGFWVDPIGTIHQTVEGHQIDSTYSY